MGENGIDGFVATTFAKCGAVGESQTIIKTKQQHYASLSNENHAGHSIRSLIIHFFKRGKSGR
jgi:hypothetical protein